MNRFLGDERGSALPLALVFMIFIALFLATLLSFVDANLRISTQLEDLRKEQYAADGAVDAAIRQYELGNGCPETVTFNEVEVGLDCPASAGGGGGGNTPDNTPPLAIIARAEGSEEGIRQASGAILQVRGGLFSNTNILTPAGEMHVTGTVRARTGCEEDDITATESIDCDIGGALYPDGDDPEYPAATAEVPEFMEVPECPGSGPVEFEPGYYNDGSALNELMDDCAGRVFWFKPGDPGIGIYYFDFLDTSDSDRIWAIESPSIVVAGTLNAPIGDIPDTDAGERCDPDEDGVQFIFGGSSRMNVTGSAELCAHPFTDSQRIAIYGLPDGDAPPGSVGPVTTTPTETAATLLFVNKDNALTINATGDCGATTCASAALVRNTAPSASITLSGFGEAPGTVVPFGSVITGATLRVAHKEASTINVIRAVITQPGMTPTTISSPTGGAPCNPATQLCRSTAYSTNTISVTSAFSTFRGVTVTYQAEITSGGPTTAGTAWLDGIELILTYTPPSFRALTAPITTAPYDQSCNCALVRTSGNNANFTVHGTVYAPTAALDIQLTNIAYQVFERGVIVRHLRANVTASSAFADSPFELPEDIGTGGADLVLFIAEVDGRTRLRALVEFPEEGPPEVLNWSVIR